MSEIAPLQIPTKSRTAPCPVSVTYWTGLLW